MVEHGVDGLGRCRGCGQRVENTLGCIPCSEKTSYTVAPGTRGIDTGDIHRAPLLAEIAEKDVEIERLRERAAFGDTEVLRLGQQIASQAAENERQAEALEEQDRAMGKDHRAQAALHLKIRSLREREDWLNRPGLVEADRLRLDWLERHPDFLGEMHPVKGIWSVTVCGTQFCGEAGNLREAIDAVAATATLHTDASRDRAGTEEGDG